MKISTYVRKFFQNEIDAFGERIVNKENDYTNQFVLGRVIATIQKKAQCVEWFEPTNLKTLLDHVHISITEYTRADLGCQPRWVIRFELKDKSKMLEHIYRMGQAVENITSYTDFSMGRMIENGELKSVAFLFFKNENI